jgi:hypothetical protein
VRRRAAVSPVKSFMNRRNFLSLFSAGVVGIALEQAIPLGRVWSFPKEIVISHFGVDIGVGDSITVNEVWRKVRNSMPERWIVSRKISDHLYEVSRPELGSFQIVDSYIKPWSPTAAFPPDSSHTPS